MYSLNVREIKHVFGWRFSLFHVTENELFPFNIPMGTDACYKFLLIVQNEKTPS